MTRIACQATFWFTRTLSAPPVDKLSRGKFHKESFFIIGNYSHFFCLYDSILAGPESDTWYIALLPRSRILHETQFHIRRHFDQVPDDETVIDGEFTQRAAGYGKILRDQGKEQSRQPFSFASYERSGTSFFI
ncbi:hypothetical protein AOLI_G00129250 [Acnodon oligacanthus]